MPKSYKKELLIVQLIAIVSCTSESKYILSLTIRKHLIKALTGPSKCFRWTYRYTDLSVTKS
jgi:hypothetical protein